MTAQKVFDNWSAYLRPVDREDFKAQLVALSATPAISGIGLVRLLREQLDECANAMRELVRLKGIKDVLDANDAGTHPLRADVWASMKLDYEDHKPLAWEAARAAVAKVPTYTQQLENVAKGLGMTTDELRAALSSTAKKEEQ